MNRFSSIFQPANEDENIALDVLLEKLDVPFKAQDMTLIDKIFLASKCAMMLYGNCQKLKLKNDSLRLQREAARERCVAFQDQLASKDRQLQAYRAKMPGVIDGQPLNKDESLQAFMQVVKDALNDSHRHEQPLMDDEKAHQKPSQSENEASRRKEEDGESLSAFSEPNLLLEYIRQEFQHSMADFRRKFQFLYAQEVSMRKKYQSLYYQSQRRLSLSGK